MRIADQQFDPAANNFTPVRLLLACAVIYSHCFLVTVGLQQEPFTKVLGRTLAGYAVDGFFAVSGFLVYRSLSRSPRISRFFLARIVRLWPALAVMVTVTALAGFVISGEDPATYLRGATTKYIVGNLSFAFGYFTLTGVQCGASPCIVNGPLWTLPWEARCYVLLGLLGAAGLTQSTWMRIALFSATLVFALAWHLPIFSSLAGSSRILRAALDPDAFDRLWTAFAIGMAIYEFRGRIDLNWPMMILLIAANLILHRVAPGPLALHFGTISTAYTVFCLAFLTAPNARGFSSRMPDYSYGTYIYAYPVMTALHEFMPSMGPYGLTILVGALTLPLAAMSWHLVEKPALDWLRRREGRHVRQ